MCLTTPKDIPFTAIANTDLSQHIPPCTRDINWELHYVYCQSATWDATGKQVACPDTYEHDQQAQNSCIDFSDPCASGGCLASPDCSLGVCRLEELNGQWICCRCGLGGNKYRFCRHPMKRSPDTLCYHVCCWECQPDSGRKDGGGSSGDGRT